MPGKACLLAGLEGIINGGIARAWSFRHPINVYQFGLLGSPVTIGVSVVDDLSVAKCVRHVTYQKCE